jgi:beta-glucosidase/6-phospho-beta-glucosidase/beta-galactosidase
MPEESKTDTSSLLEKYNEEIKKYVTVDELNMKQVQLDLPNIRHFWVGKLMFHKQEILKLKKLTKQARSKIVEQISRESPVGIPSKSLEDTINNHPTMLRIYEEIAHHEILVEYLSKIETNFRSLSYDIKNLIEIVKLETT